ncbi:hypothetical protein ACFVAQ_45015 [Streptomyces sp. NPDC057651]|uniref:hypothetical protein n=1 Tax=unclassified Streptomyces TaxID=2593676 RepID=UPI0036CBA176
MSAAARTPSGAPSSSTCSTTCRPRSKPYLPPATDDPEAAQLWYDTLQGQGIEGVVCKRATSPYRAGRIWKKVRHSDTVDADAESLDTSARRPGRTGWRSGCRTQAVSCRRR